MAHDLTGLIPTLYQALNTVNRERSGFIRAVQRNSKMERAALNQPITVSIAPTVSATDIAPSMSLPAGSGQNNTTITMTMTKAKQVIIPWQGEETLAVSTNGVKEDLYRQQFENAFREISNLIEADLASTYTASSRAVGAAGTTPFGTAGDLSDIASVLEVFDNNGSPMSDLHLVLSSAAIAKIRGVQSTLFKANEAGTDTLLREGIIGRLEGMNIHTSGQVKQHTKGTGASYLSNNASGYAINDTSIALDTGSGTILAGDVVTFAGDPNKYVNGTALSGGSIALNKPGLRAALADNVAATVGNSYRANLAFDRNAIVLGTRPPALPDGGDAAVDRQMITDPVTGLIFDVAVYVGNLMKTINISIVWGWKALKSENIVTLMG